MISPVETRWNSSLKMMRSVLQMRPALEAIKECTHRSTDSRLQDLIPDNTDMDIIEAIVPILGKFENVSDFMQSETYPTICHVMVKICFLQMSLKKCIDSNDQTSALHQLANNMSTDLEKRFPNYGSGEKAYAYTHLLHPGQKGTILYQQSIWNQTCQMMIEEEEGAPDQDAGLDQAMQVDSDEDEEQAMLASMSQAMPKGNPTDDSPMMQEIVSFVSGGLVSGKNLDVLLYWKQHEKQYPLLAKVVRKYFCIQSTSCSAERTFSTGGSTVTNKRTKLDPVNVHMLVYCRENMNKIKLDKMVLENQEEEQLEKECNKDQNDA